MAAILATFRDRYHCAIMPFFLHSRSDTVIQWTLPMTIPPYRIWRTTESLFFWPDATEHRPDHVRCVFNVKKRSWKGGVQVAVDVTQDHLAQARERMRYSAATELLQRVRQEEYDEVRRRADDLFVQALCTCTLNLALRRGLEQQNQAIAAEAFETELNRVIDEQPEQLTEPIRLELDLEDTPDACVTEGEPDGKPEGV